MIETAGQQRVIVERLLPEVDAGQFPVKRVVGDRVRVEAHLFSDGHDRIRAELLWRANDDPEWATVEMTPLYNDEWEASFAAERVGTVRYTARAWIDRFRTWQTDLEKKADAGQDVAVDLLVGAELVAAAAQRADEPDRTTIQGWADALAAKRRPAAERIALGLRPDVTALVDTYPDRRFAHRYPRILHVSVNRPRAAFSAWYEVFPRSCGEGTKHGTLADCARLLPDIAELGFDVVYLPPIHPIGRTHRKGKNNRTRCAPEDPGSPWAIGAKEGGHDAIHPQLGTEEDFRRFVAAAAAAGLDVAMDLAFQCSPDHPYVARHPAWFRWRPDGSVQFAENPPKKYEDILPLNFESDDWQALWQELRRVTLHWAGRGVRIFRVDNPHTKPFTFWEWLISEVREKHPETIFLSEAFTRPKVMGRLAKVGFDQSYTYFTWRNTKPELTEYVTQLTRGDAAEYLRPNFWPTTPDILPEFLQYGGRAAFIARFILAATLSSNYGIYGPAFDLCIADAVEGKDEYLDSEKYEIKDWDRKQRGHIRAVIQRVNRIRRENAALQTTSNVSFCEVDNDRLIAYVKASPDLRNIVLTLVNLDPHHTHAGWLKVPLHALGIAADEPYLAHDLLSDDRYLWHGEWNYVETDPRAMPAHILRIRRRVRRETDFDYFM